MPEFWVSSGHHLCRRTPDGRLGVTDALLLAWLARPEITPPPEACFAERALHARLRKTPRAPVRPGEIAALADADARENWTFFIDFRDRLLAADSVEAAWLALVRDRVSLPPIFLDQLVHLILRNALDGCADPFTLRAAELMFRPQKATMLNGALTLADAEVIEARAVDPRANPLAAMLTPDPFTELDVMTAESAGTWWSRSDAHSMGLNLGGEPLSRAGLAAAIAAFVRHLFGAAVDVSPLNALEDPDFRWCVGLDAEGSAIGDALWAGERLADETHARLIALFRMDFPPDAPLAPKAFGRPCYLLLGMDREKTVRMKPQNLVAGLPFAARPCVA
ncbi:MAG: hypothetical protein EA355_06480 [Rhodobacteraceae bacterium]|nr:MAG: hypothetical protein EA355_06480 [Paracoccaceae bacterium]